MRNAGNVLIGLLLAGVLSGCATMTVKTDYDTSANFDGLKTYEWMPHTRPQVGDARVDNTFLESRIRNAVDAELAAKGYVKDTSGSPDFQVGYHAAIRSRMDVYSMNTYYGYRPGWGWHGTDLHVYQYEEGSLVLDIVDAETKRLLWRGSAQAEMNRSATPEKREERIRQAVGKILERFPPQEK